MHIFSTPKGAWNRSIVIEEPGYFIAQGHRDAGLSEGVLLASKDWGDRTPDGSMVRDDIRGMVFHLFLSSCSSLAPDVALMNLGLFGLR